MSRLGYYQRSSNRYTFTKLQNEVLSHYQNQLLKQIHVIILGLDVLGNPLGLIRGIIEGVESLFYEPYKVSIIENESMLMRIHSYSIRVRLKVQLNLPRVWPPVF